MERRHVHRTHRLKKQEEFEDEDESFMLSPVTIRIEERGQVEENEECSKDQEILYPLQAEDANRQTRNSDAPLDDEDHLNDDKIRKRKASNRIKLLVRSQAVHDDSSPPPDTEAVIANVNMLSVTNASLFTTQTQSKGISNKTRLGYQSSSQGSTESSSASGLSRDSSTETYADSSGVDLQQFIIDTLHKNQKDRLMLLKIEQELILLMKDTKRQSMKFPQMSSYNRMLVHRVAAFFGLDHYVDGNGTAVIVNKTKSSRIPDSHFHDFIRDELLPEEPKKSILKRDSVSFEDGKEKSPERQSSTDSRRSKSFEEREEEYEKARARIFNQDEGLGESPLNRSREGTCSSSRRSSQEDVRWPSSETKPWSSTDSDSSGRPYGSKLSSSFETEVNEPPSVGDQSSWMPSIGIKLESHLRINEPEWDALQLVLSQEESSKSSRSRAVLGKASSENKALPMLTKLGRPAVTKASSFGGISLLSRESFYSKSSTPRITKAESFNVTTVTSAPVSTSNDNGEQEENSILTFPDCHDSLPQLESLQSIVTSNISNVFVNTEQTFPMVGNQLSEVPSNQDPHQKKTKFEADVHDPSLTIEFNSHTTVSQPLMWPYSMENSLIQEDVEITPQIGCQEMSYVSYQSVTVAVSTQITAISSHLPTGASGSSIQQPSIRQQPLSSLPHQQIVNMTSQSMIFIPPVAELRPHPQQPLSSSQNMKHQHQSQSTQFVKESHPLFLFPFCYVQPATCLHSTHYFPASITTQQNPQNSFHPLLLCGQNSTSDQKHNGNPLSKHTSYPALSCTQCSEAPTTSSCNLSPFYSHSTVVGNIDSPCKSQFSSHSSLPPVFVQPSTLPIHTAVTLPPVYVSITSSTQSPAAQTHAGGHKAAQYSSFCSQPLPISSSSQSSVFNHHLHSGIPFLGYTIYAPAFQGITSHSSLIRVTLNQSSHSLATSSQLTPAYMTAFQVLQPGVPLVANNTLPSHNLMCSQYPALSSISKVPISFPFVKQRSDAGIGECLNMRNEFCLIGPPLQHLPAPLLFPQLPPMARLTRASSSGQSHSSRLAKSRKQRSKGMTTSLVPSTSSSEIEFKGNTVLEIEGLPENMKQHDVEIYLEEVINHGGKIHFLNADFKEKPSNSTEFISNSRNTVLAVFECDSAAQSALLSIKTNKFQLRHWHHSFEDRQTKKKSS